MRIPLDECSVLPLVLTGKWYDMIHDGGKREEYRLASPYWRKRIRNWNDRGGMQVVAFSRGYTKPSMYFLADTYLRTNKEPPEHPEWGEALYADKEAGYFALKLLTPVEILPSPDVKMV